MINKYAFKIRPLTEKEGGGFLIEYPDLPGCTSDGATIEEAIANGQDAVKCWIEVAESMGREIPQVSSQLPSGKWVQRVPKTLHARLVTEAEREGVSLNALVIALIANGLRNYRYQKDHNNY